MNDLPSDEAPSLTACELMDYHLGRQHTYADKQLVHRISYLSSEARDELEFSISPSPA